LTQKKTLEINPRHPVIKELLRRVETGADEEPTKNMALMMFQTGKEIFAPLTLTSI
jgi:heat shock protein beta